MAHRSFEEGRLARLHDQADPITFDVAGREFLCLPVPPLGAVQLLSELPDLPARDDPTYRAVLVKVAAGVTSFIRSCIVGDQRPGWDGLLVDEYLDDDTLVDILDWLAGEYRARLVSDPAPAAPAPPQAPSLAVGPHLADLEARARRVAAVIRAGGEVPPPAAGDVDGRRIHKLAAVLLADPDADIEGLDPDRLDDALLFGRG